MTVYEREKEKAERKRHAALHYALAGLLEHYRDGDPEFQRQLRDAEARVAAVFGLPPHVRETLRILTDQHDAAIKAAGLPALTAENPWLALLDKVGELRALLSETRERHAVEATGLKQSVETARHVADMNAATVCELQEENAALTKKLADAESKLPKTFKSIRRIA